ncbi:MAG: methylglyoxal synthase [Candidatus Geothermincolia bacterium]
MVDHKIVTAPVSRQRSGRTTSIALIAHDARKRDIADFAARNGDFLATCTLAATGATGQLIADETGLPVKRMLPGPEGGDLQIGGLVASGEIDMIIFLRDPLTAQPHDPDVSALLRVCDVHNVPLATNLASAELLLAAGMARASLMPRA